MNILETVIEAEGLSKIYKLYNSPKDRLYEAIFPFLGKNRHREFAALKDISFSIKKGESVGIIGKNGSGKSTLLKILTGVITGTSGKIETKGRIAALIELGAGFNPEYTGLENIFLNSAIMGCTKAETEKKLDGILSFAEIGDFINQPVKTYSSGMFVRLAFSVAIHSDPDILIVDEALAVGDYRFQAKCYNKFDELKKAGKTVLFVSHDIDAVRRFCTRAIWLDASRLIMDSGVNEVTSKYMEYITDGDKKSPSEVLAGAKETAPKKEAEKPINRFGTNLGSIKSAILMKGGAPAAEFKIGDEAELLITLDIPENADFENLAVSVGLKDKNGLDLFVVSTFDKGIRFEKAGETLLSVKFPNYFNKGTYTVIAALESRKTLPISYYDYIEGAAYLKVSSEEELFGFVQLPAEIKVIREGENS